MNNQFSNDMKIPQNILEPRKDTKTGSGMEELVKYIFNIFIRDLEMQMVNQMIILVHIIIIYIIIQ